MKFVVMALSPYIKIALLHEICSYGTHFGTTLLLCPLRVKTCTMAVDRFTENGKYMIDFSVIAATKDGVEGENPTYGENQLYVGKNKQNSTNLGIASIE